MIFDPEWSASKRIEHKIPHELKLIPVHIAGFYLFGPSSEGEPGSPYFRSLLDSFINLFVLLTTANYPGTVEKTPTDEVLVFFFIIGPIRFFM